MVTLKHVRSLVAPVASLGLALALPAWAWAGDDDDDIAIPDEALIRLAPGFDIEDFNLRYGTEVEEAVPSRNIFLLDLDDDIGDPEAWVNQVRLDNPPGLLWIEANYEGQDGEGRTGSFYVSDINGRQNYGNQFPRTQQQLPNVHLLTTGENILIALLDTGLDASHELFAGRVAPGGYNFVDDNTDTSDVRDFEDNDGDGVFDESWGHGTFMGGLIMMMAPDARLLPVKVLNSDGRGDAFTLALGIFHAIDQGADVINMSLGTTYNAEVLEDAVEEAKDRGVILVAAAGNRNLNADEDDSGKEFPALKTSAVGVASLNDQDVKSDFSNYGKRIKISAPGSDQMWSSIPVNDEGHDYAAWEGTSLATAIVSGSAALILARHPEWPRNEARWALVVESIQDTAVDIYEQNGSYASDQQLGAGRIDTLAALDAPVDTAFLTGYDVAVGTYIEGDLDSLDDNDNDGLRVRSGFGRAFTERHKSDVVFEGVVFPPDVARVELEIEQRVNQPAGVARVFVWRWASESWVQVFSRAIGSNDVFNLINIPNHQQYLDADGRMRIMVRHIVYSPMFAFNFVSRYDIVKIEVE
jgi:subtilisin family serine protease